MSETDVRDLFAAATSDAVLGKSTVDVDAVISRERRSAGRRRVLAVGGVVAAFVGLAIAVPIVMADRGSDTAPPVGTSPPSPPPTPGPLATRLEREQFAIQALTDHFPGAGRRALDYTYWDGRVSVNAQLPGTLLFAEALRVQANPEHPCRGAVAPACAEYPQPDGSVVMVQRDRAGGNSTIIAIHLRTNGTHVQVGASITSDTLDPPFSDEVMVAAATDPRFTAMAPGTGE
jgi:hypothetical protein